MRPIRAAVGWRRSSTPKLLTSAERLQYEGYLRREETNAAHHGRRSTRAFRFVGSRSTLAIAASWLRAVARGERSDVSVPGELTGGLSAWLNAQWGQRRVRNATALWRKLKDQQGFRGSLCHRRVGDPPTRSETASAETLTRVPSARTIARLMTIQPRQLTKAESVIVAAIECGVRLSSRR